MGGPRIVWSRPKGRCVPVPSTAPRTCPASKPLLGMNGCFPTGFCTSKALATCRSSCRWGTSSSRDTVTVAIQAILKGITQAQFNQLRPVYIEAIAEFSQVSRDAVKLTQVELKGEQLIAVAQ